MTDENPYLASSTRSDPPVETPAELSPLQLIAHVCIGIFGICLAAVTGFAAFFVSCLGLIAIDAGEGLAWFVLVLAVLTGSVPVLYVTVRTIVLRHRRLQGRPPGRQP